ncbi:MAG: hypothetical protein RBU21_19940, partial [FCB group bacterium]|nr:hypothetical protein [FCB group bacterium]
MEQPRAAASLDLLHVPGSRGRLPHTALALQIENRKSEIENKKPQVITSTWGLSNSKARDSLRKPFPGVFFLLDHQRPAEALLRL